MDGVFGNSVMAALLLRTCDTCCIFLSFGWVLVLARAVACFFAEGVDNVAWVYFIYSMYSILG